MHIGCGSGQPSAGAHEESGKRGSGDGTKISNNSSKPSGKTQNKQGSSSSKDRPLDDEASPAQPNADAIAESNNHPPSTETPQTNENSSDHSIADCIEAPQPWICNVEQEIWALVAIERQKINATPLSFDAELSYTARQWSIEQAARRLISHEWFQTGQLKLIHQQKFGEDPRLAAENVAMVPCSVDPKATAQAFMSAWMNSSGHRANILLNGIKRLGVGIAHVDAYCFGTQDFGF